METSRLEVSVLYVEDDQMTRMVMTSMLERGVRSVMTAGNGVEGLDMYRRYVPDVVVSDIMMPEMNGLEMARAIKQADGNQPIIMTTAFSDTDFFLEAIEIGIDRYVLKPVDSEVLLATIRKCAETVFLARELKKREVERERLIGELQEAMARIQTLQGILPICASCKRIRDDQGGWNPIEDYIRAHSSTEFTHGICPACAARLYPGFYKPRRLEGAE